MKSKIRTVRLLLFAASLLASLFCLLGGLWILRSAALAEKEDSLGVGLGFYFIGKAFFVGPMLWLVSGRLQRGKVEGEPV